MPQKRWIQTALRKKRKGALSRQLGIPEKENIPLVLLSRIKNAKIGSNVKNPSKKGKRNVKVTHLLKKRATIAATLKKLKH